MCKTNGLQRTETFTVILYFIFRACVLNWYVTFSVSWVHLHIQVNVKQVTVWHLVVWCAVPYTAHTLVVRAEYYYLLYFFAIFSHLCLTVCKYSPGFIICILFAQFIIFLCYFQGMALSLGDKINMTQKGPQKTGGA